MDPPSVAVRSWSGSHVKSKKAQASEIPSLQTFCWGEQSLSHRQPLLRWSIKALPGSTDHPSFIHLPHVIDFPEGTNRASIMADQCSIRVLRVSESAHIQNVLLADTEQELNQLQKGDNLGKPDPPCENQDLGPNIIHSDDGELRRAECSWDQGTSHRTPRNSLCAWLIPGELASLTIAWISRSTDPLWLPGPQFNITFPPGMPHVFAENSGLTLMDGY